MSEATWSLTETGKTYHSFKADGTAICRKNIRLDDCRALRTEEQVDVSLAKPWGVSTQGYRKCESCAKKEAAFQDRQEASMQPSTGEGDCLPPAEGDPEACCDHEGMYHGGQGCDLCPCDLPRNQFPQRTKESQMSKFLNGRKTSGPLNPQQHTVMQMLSEGSTHVEIAETLGVSREAVSQNVCIVVAKMGVRTTANAVARYNRFQAHMEVSKLLLRHRVVSPDDPAEEHVNHVLEGMAEQVQRTGERLLPQ